jgi:hypothetical protein
MSKPKREDLEPGTLERLSWQPDKAPASLDAVFDYAKKVAEDAIAWYREKKPPKKRWARWCRGLAIALGSAAAILPILAQIFRRADGVPVIAPAWASAALVVAAALVAFDRFFGFSSAWIRFMKADLRLTKTLAEFYIDWEAEKAVWKGAQPDEDQLKRMLGRAKKLITEVNDIVQEETNEWIRDFQSALKQIDQAAKPPATPPSPSGGP